MKHNPTALDDFVGQDDIKERLQTAIEASKQRNEPIKHILFFGPPGLGKTTLAKICAEERGVELQITSGPALTKAKVNKALLGTSELGIFFIDEIHQLSLSAEEVLYPAMEEGFVDLETDNGTRPIEIPNFTLMGATTRKGNVSGPLLTRFTYEFKLSFYDEETLAKVILKMAQNFSVNLSKPSARLIARRARGTPREARQIVSYLADYKEVHGKIKHGELKQVLCNSGYYKGGLDKLSIEYLEFLNNFGPAGVSSIAPALVETERTIEKKIEPHLLRNGYIIRNSRGRNITDEGKQILQRVKSNLEDN